MLLRVFIHNYAIIEEIDLYFYDNFNVITGETGAGKSILLGALGLILGKRADASVAREKEKKCIVEATFDIKKYNLSKLFEQQELDYHDECIIRREINTNGKSRAFINDTPVNLDILQQVSTLLLDIHAQGEVQKLLDEYFFCTVLDEMSKQTKEIELYENTFSDYISQKGKLNKLKKQQADLQKEYDFNSFLLNEFENINLDHEYYQQLEQEIALQENAEIIISNLSETEKLLDAHELSILPQLIQANKLIQPIASVNDVFLEMQTKISSTIDELKSLQRQIKQNIDVVEYQPEQLQQIQETLNQYNKLMQKHHVNTIDELNNIKSELEKKNQSFNANNDEINDLEKSISTLKSKLQQTAKIISNNRKKHIASFEQNLATILKNIGMPFAKVLLQQQTVELNKKGEDELLFYFSPNKGIEPKLLSQVGSGGEKSRLMLAIKSLTADNKSGATIIFDEIDTGISGEVANKVAELLRNIGNTHQIIAITHLPQVAAKGNHHYYVYKKHDKQITYTEIKKLSNEERIKEIATMLSGENPSTAAIENAKILLG